MKQQRLYLVVVEMPDDKWTVFSTTESDYKAQLWFKKYTRLWGEMRVYCRYPKNWTEKQARDIVYSYFTVQSA